MMTSDAGFSNLKNNVQENTNFILFFEKKNDVNTERNVFKTFLAVFFFENFLQKNISVLGF